ncbi:MAG: hypothetical protein MSG64_09640 [Pyrinomonadaceae bacterium MAG19_C2-C3]|nr:hypothetical protein [Pyrinomonadaceae bacterium MAG19_C2-C3]
MKRLFLDSGVVLKSIFGDYGFSKSIFALCAVRIHQLVLAEVVRQEIENNLLQAFYKGGNSDKVLSDFDTFLRKARPEVIAPPSVHEALQAARIIRHINDAPVLASAILAKPDWLITNISIHFTPDVAFRTSLRIGTPYNFMYEVHSRYN